MPIEGSSFIEIRHNIEVAHRLSKLPGKCQNIHGHSMWVNLTLYGDLDEQGILAGIDFGLAKSHFRQYLDQEFDHRLLLNKTDPLVGSVLPGMNTCTDDPTTENIAKWIGQWGCHTFGKTGIIAVECRVQETGVNFAGWYGAIDEEDSHEGHAAD